MAENLVEQYGWGREVPHSFQFIEPNVVRVLERLSVRRVLDIGSGNGVLCAVLASKGYDMVGIEYDEGGVAMAKSSYPGLPFYRFGVQGNPSALLALEKPFDVVISTEVIEHLFSPHLLPQYASAVLKQNGYLIVSTPYHGYLKNLALSLFDAWDKHHTSLWCGGHVKFWSKKTLTTLLEGNGFGVVGFSGVGRLPFLWRSMILVAQKT